MIKKFLTATAVALGLMAVPATASTFEEIGAATYKLHDGMRPICSAVAVSPTQLVTANHCVGSDDLNIQIVKLDDEFKPVAIDVKFVKTIRTLREYDQAMLELKDGILPSYVDMAKPEEVDLKLGTPMITVGYPMVQEITLTHGEFSAMASLVGMDSDMKKPFYKSTIPVTGGNSGGGAYIEIDGTWKLIGLTTGGYRHVSFMNYFSTVDGLKSLTANLIKLEEKEDTSGLEGEVLKNSERETGELINPADLR